MNTNIILLLILAVNVVVLALCVFIIVRLKLIKYLLEQPLVKKLSPSTKLRRYKSEKKPGSNSRTGGQRKPKEKNDNRNKGRQNRNPRQIARNERPKPVTLGNKAAEKPSKPEQKDIKEKSEKSKPAAPAAEKPEPKPGPAAEKSAPEAKEPAPVQKKKPEVVKETVESQPAVQHGRRAKVVQKPVFSAKED